MDAEAELLRRHGHTVFELQRSNAEVIGKGLFRVGRALLASAWNRHNYRLLRAAIRRLRPDVVHVHNVWFALSPSVLGAAHDEGVPTVMTLHNFRLLCVGGTLLRDGTPCEQCVGRPPWPGVAHGCYRDSPIQSALLARMLQHNRRRGTWVRDVDAFVALTEFCRRKFVQGGLPARRIVVKPNFLPDPGAATLGGSGAVFVGRLSVEKGPHTLVEAWRQLPEVPLTVVGDGPMRNTLERRVKREGSGAVRFAGERDRKNCFQSIREGAVLVMPSVWYEGFPRTLVESFALGRAVIASRLGSLS